ncbi:MAG TPA: PIG-L family deacetylase [Actinomycetota bacterium]|nr:PIG-L family deacetylase [Actinomycetota bacterium]
MTLDVSKLGTILGVWAHPDDETYLSGGIMALAVRAGQRVVCVTATRGEKGSQDEVRWPSATIGSVREKELERALGVLGVREHHWLGYVDGECDGVDDAEAAGRLARIVEDVAPDTVLTFGPDGQTGHPDHLAVYRWVDAACPDGEGPAVMWAAVPDDWRPFAERLDEFDVFAPGTPEFVPRAELDVLLDLDDDLMDLKLGALREQPSQTEGLLGALGEEFVRASLSVEAFRRAGG